MKRPLTLGGLGARLLTKREPTSFFVVYFAVSPPASPLAPRRFQESSPSSLCIPPSSIRIPARTIYIKYRTQSRTSSSPLPSIPSVALPQIPRRFPMRQRGRERVCVVGRRGLLLERGFSRRGSRGVRDSCLPLSATSSSPPSSSPWDRGREACVCCCSWPNRRY